MHVQVLEASAGTGRNIAWYDDRVKQVVFTDVSYDMLKRAKLRWEERPRRYDAAFVLSDVQALTAVRSMHGSASASRRPYICALVGVPVLQGLCNRNWTGFTSSAAALQNTPGLRNIPCMGLQGVDLTVCCLQVSGTDRGSSTAADAGSDSASLRVHQKPNKSVQTLSSTPAWRRWFVRELNADAQELPAQPVCLQTGDAAGTTLTDRHRFCFPEHSFDTVVDTFGLCSCANPVEALRQMSRVRQFHPAKLAQLTLSAVGKH